MKAISKGFYIVVATMLLYNHNVYVKNVISINVCYVPKEFSQKLKNH